MVLPIALVAIFLGGCTGDSAPLLNDSSPSLSIASPSEAAQTSPTFTFSRGTCEQGSDYCALREDKDWTDVDKTLVESAFAEIFVHESGRRVLRAAYDKGYTTLRRYRVYATRGASGAWEIPDGGRSAANQHASQYGQWIDVNDAIHQLVGVKDQRGGYSAVTEIILHEFFHAFDRTGPGVYRSESEDFWKLVGFRQIGSGPLGFQFMFRLQSQADRANALRAQSKAKAETGATAEWWGLNRSEVWTPMPSEVAATNPRDAFAEIGSHLVLDPTARTYLDPKVVEYFDREVFGRR